MYSYDCFRLNHSHVLGLSPRFGMHKMTMQVVGRTKSRLGTWWSQNDYLQRVVFWVRIKMTMHVVWGWSVFSGAVKCMHNKLAVCI